MVVKFNRAQRRADRARMYKKARALQEMWWSYSDYSEEVIHKLSCRLRDNMKICSCQMCRNPRHSWWTNGKERFTMQERKANEAFKDEMRELE